MNFWKKILSGIVSFSFLFGFVSLSYAATVSLVPGSSEATFSNSAYGTVSFATSGSSLATAGATPVSITNASMTGEAWGDHVGWIEFNGTGTPANNIAVTCSGTTATLSGYGWGENTSWVNFGPFTGGAASSQPTIDASGNFSGAAWTENFGWLDLSGLKATATPCNAPTPPVTPTHTTGGGAALLYGCKDPTATNFNPNLSIAPDNSECLYKTQNLVCSDPAASNYSSQGTSDPALCLYGGGLKQPQSAVSTQQPTQPSSTSFVFNKNLKKGVVDGDVSELEGFLDSHGYPVATTGWGSINQLATTFGTKTFLALKKYQASVGLPATGYFGPMTRAEVNKILSN